MYTLRSLFAAALLLGGCLNGSDGMHGTLVTDLTPGPGGEDGGSLPSGDGGPVVGEDAGPIGSSDAGPVDACTGVSCGTNEHCEAALCVCDTGYSKQGGTCQATPVGDPTSHSQADVCSKFNESATVSPNFFSVSATTCDAGQLTADGVANAVARINYHRWLVGLAPVTAGASQNNLAQKCALVSAWNPAGPAAHNPTAAAQCYTSEGAAGAGSSNIAWGSNNPVDAIDQWIDDSGNGNTMGHRRWIINPPLNPIGFGLYEGGDAGYGSAACMVVFNSSGTGPRPDFVAYPPAGFVPVELTKMTWTFSADGFAFSAATTVTVTRMSDSANMAVTVQPVNNPGPPNYMNATSFYAVGWEPQAGQTYRVTVTAGAKSQAYDVKPVGC